MPLSGSTVSDRVWSWGEEIQLVNNPGILTARLQVRHPVSKILPVLWHDGPLSKIGWGICITIAIESSMMTPITLWLPFITLDVSNSTYRQRSR
jgi:hypothetical protein